MWLQGIPLIPTKFVVGLVVSQPAIYNLITTVVTTAREYMIKWTKGRQNTGYDKLKLFELGSKGFGGVDCYILRYNVGDEIPMHTDPVPGKRHYRLNFELKKAELGGRLYVKNPIFRFWRLCVFRSDLSKHAVTKIDCGQRLVFSLGLAF